MAKFYKCPDCGEVYEEQAIPTRCTNCGSHKNVFHLIDESELSEQQKNAFRIKVNNTQSNVGEINTQNGQYQLTTDEGTVRLYALLNFIVTCILGGVGVIAGIIIISEGNDFEAILGGVLIFLGAVIFLAGWILRAFIRLFANMSDRLNSIDSKIK